MSILCGLFPPSSGTAFINGYSIKTDIEGVRQSLGVCPQFNALFGELTSREHLEFFSYLKGVDPSFISKDVESMLQNIQMMDKADLPVSSLSGGMKRKLSAAIAFIGGSKTIILDEPTAGRVFCSFLLLLFEVLFELFIYLNCLYIRFFYTLFNRSGSLFKAYYLGPPPCI